MPDKPDLDLITAELEASLKHNAILDETQSEMERLHVEISERQERINTLLRWREQHEYVGEERIEELMRQIETKDPE